MFNYLFYVLLDRPPTSPLFPYTTLFRSGHEGVVCVTRIGEPAAQGSGSRSGRRRAVRSMAWSRRHAAMRAWRSEEHTSELQSRGHLVCRLLLEKKKIQTYIAKRTVYTRP